MSCSKQAGPAAYLKFIEDATGERVSQAEWHEIRRLAAQHEGGLSRSRATDEDAMEAAQSLAASLYEERGVEWGPADDIAAFDSKADDLFSAVGDAKNTEGTVAAIRYLADKGAGDVLAQARANVEAASEQRRNERIGATSSLHAAYLLAQKRSDRLAARYNREYAAGKWSTNRRLAGQCEEAYSEAERAKREWEESLSASAPVNAVPDMYADAEWASEVYWPNVPVAEREAFAWAMDSRTLSFYTPATNEEGTEERDWAEPDSAGQVATALRSLPNDADDATVIKALESTPLSEYFYLADDGGNHPALTLWEEWQSSGPTEE